MKKLASILVAGLMISMVSMVAFAAPSPTAPTISPATTDASSNEKDTTVEAPVSSDKNPSSPATGSISASMSKTVVASAAVIVTLAAAGVYTSKKKNEE